MGWYNDAWNWISSKIGGFVHDNSWLGLAKAGGAILLILSVIGIVAFWWWLLHKALNHGGDH